MAQYLGFDLLRRGLCGIDQYFSTLSLPVVQLERPYADCCRELAALKELPKPATRNWQALEAAGRKHLVMVHNLELVHVLFRRPLELWLLLDRCLYLIGQGHNVRLGEFCPISLSPRDLLILAEFS